jgi:hypothetical protein
MFKSPLEKLRQSHWSASFPDTIEEERRSLGQTILALEDMLRMARRQGAKGSDNAVAAAARDLEARK